MYHAVLFLVLACKFVFLYHSVDVVFHMGAYNKTVQRLAVHCLRIDVVLFLVVLHEPAVLLELLEVLYGFAVDLRGVLVCPGREINLGAGDMIQRHLIVAGLFACLIGTKHVIWPALNLFGYVFGRS